MDKERHTQRRFVRLTGCQLAHLAHVGDGERKHYTQFVYDPLGDKLGIMNGQTLDKVRVPLPGGGMAIYGSTGPTLQRYWHPDGLGSIRLASNPNQTFYGDSAYAPYGDQYAATTNPSGVYAGLMADTVGSLNDALFREYDPNQGRWLSPDPAGLAAWMTRIRSPSTATPMC